MDVAFLPNRMRGLYLRKQKKLKGWWFLFTVMCTAATNSCITACSWWSIASNFQWPKVLWGFPLGLINASVKCHSVEKTENCAVFDAWYDLKRGSTGEKWCVGLSLLLKHSYTSYLMRLRHFTTEHKVAGSIPDYSGHFPDAGEHKKCQQVRISVNSKSGLN